MNVKKWSWGIRNLWSPYFPLASGDRSDRTTDLIVLSVSFSLIARATTLALQHVRLGVPSADICSTVSRSLADCYQANISWEMHHGTLKLYSSFLPLLPSYYSRILSRAWVSSLPLLASCNGPLARFWCCCCWAQKVIHAVFCSLKMCLFPEALVSVVHV